ncbi:MAG: HTH-type transcriptional repressor YvoA [Acidobacteria bacterium]|nr:HTH-type transcriptional repressor YvoA [Acidobacteriota bacterium]
MAKLKSAFVSSRIPLYYQLENLLREKILSGAFGAGDRLPTESDLIRDYGVSRITVRQALAALAEEGLIERRQGRGTFAAERRAQRRPFESAIHFTGSLDELIDMALDTPIRVLETTRIEADQREAELLGLQAGEPVYRFKRLRLREDNPFSLIVNYLPAEIGARITDEELSSSSLLRLLETKLGAPLHSAKQQIMADLADPHVAGLLDVRVGAPLLSIERAVYTEEGRPVEYAHALYRSDCYNYTIYLTRDPNRKAQADKANREPARPAPAKRAERSSRKVKTRG